MMKKERIVPTVVMAIVCDGERMLSTERVETERGFDMKSWIMAYYGADTVILDTKELCNDDSDYTLTRVEIQENTSAAEVEQAVEKACQEYDIFNKIQN